MRTSHRKGVRRMNLGGNLLSNILQSNFKNRDPYSTNPVYHKTLFIGCPYCVHPGSKKNFKNLWVLYMHFRTHHKDERDFKDRIMQLADLVIERCLL